MAERFKLSRVNLSTNDDIDKLKVNQLISLLDDHPYKEDIIKTFDLNLILDEDIDIGNINSVYKKIKKINNDFKRFNIITSVKNVFISESNTPIADLSTPHPLIFNFSEYIREGGVEHDLNCYAIYDSKSSFFDGYEMSKYANYLYKSGLGELAAHNLEYFRKRANENIENRENSYRIVENNGDLFLRGITSTNQYFEYGVDFAFVVTMLLLHKDRQHNSENKYMITSAFLSESKLELIVANANLKDAGLFGEVSSALVIRTNDIGQGSLNFTKIIKVGSRIDRSMYLYPKSHSARINKLIINHSTSLETALNKLKKLDSIFNNTDDYIADLHEVKSIKQPEELRNRIYIRLNNPRNALSKIESLKDIFKIEINDEIEDFVKLLEMCNKAEELDIDYDLKEKLRYLISDVILKRKLSE